MNTKSPIDIAIFEELRDTAGADFVAELVDTFLEEAPAILAEMHAARGAGDALGFQRAAHSLKSNANTFGGVELGGLARELELGGLAGASDERLQALDAAWQRAATALKELQHG